MRIFKFSYAKFSYNLQRVCIYIFANIELMAWYFLTVGALGKLNVEETRHH